MTYVTGLFLIDANASALNNLGAIEGERYDNSTGVKVIRTNEGFYPYISAQAFRYWLRQTLQQSDFGWKSAPVYREEKIAYTDANPIKWWDDDLFGYMRAPSKRESAKAKREADSSRMGETETTDTITRTSPFRVSTLVSIAPVRPTNDFGVMSRQDGDPVPHEHQFYRTTLQGLFSLSLKSSGTFWYKKKTGFRNLDDVRIDQAKAENLELLEDEKAYRLPKDQRLQRITSLFEGMAKIEGGAKLSIHYTDVSPVVVILAVTKGGNHIFSHVIGENKGRPEVNLEALKESLQIFNDEIVSDIFIGWVRGYSEEERNKIEAFAKTAEAKTENGKEIKLSHPREAFKNLIAEMKKPENSVWLE
ncbi:MAG TPA: type I-B CRISPR-associated protein Cas7/Cst2/DevR [Methanothrix sp.]|jgi:CRISPR-associated protein Cst2|uniref:type I-B CRISPR-associated protein Cas7/Cst2/DevR n=1 Tax=Methanothrix sp. TaxID=90426 RepID=UPI002D07DFE9|nr:type I-B CRISPR-associated protein Cas7/Cst2/DevR [Euryarchaeota archaeon]HON36467.1 type I-B CRISPR-associated protein Cas7/Cst2/DevR [Methanothrix sp.]